MRPLKDERRCAHWKPHGTHQFSSGSRNEVVHFRFTRGQITWSEGSRERKKKEPIDDLAESDALCSESARRVVHSSEREDVI